MSSPMSVAARCLSRGKPTRPRMLANRSRAAASSAVGNLYASGPGAWRSSATGCRPALVLKPCQTPAEPLEMPCPCRRRQTWQAGSKTHLRCSIHAPICGHSDRRSNWPGSSSLAIA